MYIIGLKMLCPPAEFYLVVSMIGLVIMSFQNFGTSSVYCLGNLACDVKSVYSIFFTKLFYILITTWVLNIICRKVSVTLSWLIIFIPILFYFISIILIFYKTA
jgi:hypothetical protein